MVNSHFHVRNQSTPTTKKVVRIYSSCVTLIKLFSSTLKYYQENMPFFMRNLNMHILLPTRVRAFFRMALFV